MFDLPLKTLVQRIQSRQVTARAVMEQVYHHIERLDSTLCAYQSLLSREQAIRRAEAIDAKAASGKPLGRLAGIPVSTKGNICIQDTDLNITCSSKILENFKSPYNATVTDLLQREDAVIIGVTNMDEFAMGSSTENSAFGVTRNPWDTDRVPGGSSGGAAVTVAAKMALLALGSDTGGSVRQPASMCGVTGFKPTYGAVSRYGLIAYGSSLDQIGVLAKSAEDCQYVFPIIQQYDPKDSTSIEQPFPSTSLPHLKDLKICIPQEYLAETSMDSEVYQSVMEMRKILTAAGAVIEERSLPFTQYVVPTYYILAFAEASSNLGRFDGIRYGLRQQKEASLESLYRTSRGAGFGTEVKRRIMLGTFVLSAGYYEAYYHKALKVRAFMEQEIDALFQEFDLILGPVSPYPAFKLGEKIKDPLSLYLADIYSALSNLTRTPSISIPGQPASNGLPIGIQLIGRKGADYQILELAHAIQSITNFHQLKQD